MKRLTIQIFLPILLAILGGCSDTPNKSESLGEANAVASSDSMGPAIFKVEDLIRENGWLDGSYYKIRFNYNLTSQKAYTEMLAERMALDSEAYVGETEEQITLAFGMQAMADQLAGLSGQENVLKTVTAIMEKDGTEIGKALRKNPIQVANFNAIVNAKDGDKRIVLWIRDAHKALNDIGLPDGSAVGTKIPRTVTFTYMKTENGWKKVV